MAKFKPARGRRAPATTRPNAIGCIILLVLLFGLVYGVLFFAVRGQ